MWHDIAVARRLGWRLKANPLMAIRIGVLFAFADGFYCNFAKLDRIFGDIKFCYRSERSCTRWIDWIKFWFLADSSEFKVFGLGARIGWQDENTDRLSFYIGWDRVDQISDRFRERWCCSWNEECWQFTGWRIRKNLKNSLLLFKD